MTIAVKNAVAQAIAELKKFGSISAETFANIGNLGGSIGGVLTQYVDKYAALAVITDKVTAAQDRLNGITRKYDAILKPLQNKLNQISNIRQNEADDKRIAVLRRLINNSQIGGAKRREAELELQELLLQKQIRNTTAERDDQTTAIQTQLDLSQQQQEAAQKELALFEARIQQQAGYNQLLAQASTQVEKALGGVAKAAKAGLTELEKQLKAIQFQRQELADMKRAFELNLILEDKSATAAEKKAAQLELQEISLRRQQRILEASKLGIELPDLSGIQITMADIKKGGDSALDGFSTDLEGLKNLDLAGSFKSFQDAVDESKNKFKAFGDQISLTLRKVNNALPGFLKFLGDDGKITSTSKGLNTLSSAFKGLGVAIAIPLVGNTFLKFGATLLGFNGKLKFIASAIGIFVAAWEGNWFNIQSAVTKASESINRVLSGGFSLPKIEGSLPSFEGFTSIVNGINTSIKRLTGGMVELNDVFAIIGITIARKSGVILLGKSLGILRPILASITPLLLGLGRGLIATFSSGALLGGLRSISLLLLNVARSTNVILLATSVLTQAYIKDWFGIRTATVDGVKAIIVSLDTLFGTKGFSNAANAIYNFSVSIGDAIGGITKAFLDLASGSIGLDEFKEKLSGIGGNLLQPFEETIQRVRDGFSSVIEFFTFDSVGDAIGKLFIELPSLFVSGFVRLVGYVLTFIPNIISAGVRTIGSELGTAIDFLLGDVAGGIVKGIRFIILGISAIFSEEARTEFTNIIAGLFEGDGSFLSEILQSFSNGQENVQGAVDEALGQIKSAFDNTWETVIKPAFIQAGTDVMLGLFNGMQEFVDSFGFETISNIVRKILDTFKQFLGIASPSTLFYDEVGTPIGRGILSGISDWITAKYQTVVDAIVALKDFIFSEETLGKFTTAAFDLGASIIQGVIDGFNSLWDAAKSLYDSTVGSLISGAKNLFGGGDVSASTEPLTQSVSEGLSSLNKDELVGVFSEAILKAFTGMKGDVVSIFTTMGTDAVAALTTFKTNAETVVNTFVLDAGLAFLNLGTELVATTDLTTSVLLERYTLFAEDLTGDEGIVNKLTATVVEFFDTMGTKVVSAVDSMVAKILEAFTGDEGLIAKLRTDFVDKGNTLGLDFVTGIEQAILDNIDKVAAASAKVAKEALRSGSEEMEAESPSKRAAREIGKPFTDGITQGILGGVASLTKNTGSMIESLFGIASAVESRMGASPSGSTINNSSQRVNNYNLNVNSSLPSAGVVRDFGIMQTLAG